MLVCLHLIELQYKTHDYTSFITKRKRVELSYAKINIISSIFPPPTLCYYTPPLHCKKKRKFCKKFPSHIKDQSLGLKGNLDPFNVREESLNGKGINWASLMSKGSFQSRGLYFFKGSFP